MVRVKSAVFKKIMYQRNRLCLKIFFAWSFSSTDCVKNVSRELNQCYIKEVFDYQIALMLGMLGKDFSRLHFETF